MVAFQCFIDEMVDLTLLINILLSGILGEDIVEVEVFRSMTVVDLYFPALWKLPDARVLVAILYFIHQEGSDTNGGLDFTTH
jgi:hypothetical protein